MNEGNSRAIALICIIGGQKVAIPYHEAARWGTTLTEWAARQKELRDGEQVFACTSEAIDESCGYADLLDCVCKDEDVHPQAICPVHGEVYD